MKIAVQISGAVRTLNQSYRSLEEQILNRYDCDIYFSTFGTYDTNIIELFGNRLVEARFLPFDIDSTCIRELNDKYKHTTEKDFKGAYLFVRQLNVLLGMYHKMYCNQVRVENIKNVQYDVVISTRTDLHYGEPLALHHVQAARECVLIPVGFDWDSGINDLFQIGPPDHMTTVCNEFLYYQQCMNMGFVTHPENLFRQYLNYQCVPYTRFLYVMYLRGIRTS